MVVEYILLILYLIVEAIVERTEAKKLFGGFATQIEDSYD